MSICEPLVRGVHGYVSPMPFPALETEGKGSVNMRQGDLRARRLLTGLGERFPPTLDSGGEGDPTAGAALLQLIGPTSSFPSCLSCLCLCPFPCRPCRDLVLCLRGRSLTRLEDSSASCRLPRLCGLLYPARDEDGDVEGDRRKLPLCRGPMLLVLCRICFLSLCPADEG